MAFRIHDSVVRGEIDNRVNGIVRGKIWVEGRAEPERPDGRPDDAAVGGVGRAVDRADGGQHAVVESMP